MNSSTVRLSALDGTPLSDPKIRDTVVAAAESIAERTGVRLTAVLPADDSITLTIETDRIAALGFAAELRRVTDRWYAAKHDGTSLWGRLPEDHQNDFLNDQS